MLAGITALAVSTAPAASRATSRHVTEHITLKLAKRTNGTTFVHTGRADGTVDGKVRSTISLSHAVVLRGTVTITTSAGKMRLKVDGRARSLEQKTKFNGTATMLAGTGRYADGAGKGTFSGVVDRSTWAVTIDAAGTFRY